MYVDVWGGGGEGRRDLKCQEERPYIVMEDFETGRNIEKNNNKVNENMKYKNKTYRINHKKKKIILHHILTQIDKLYHYIIFFQTVIIIIIKKKLIYN